MSSDNKGTGKQKSGDKPRRNQNQLNHQGTQAPQAQPKIKGRTKKLENYIYDARVQNQANMFTNTTKEVANYAGCHCKDPRNIRNTLELLREVTIPPPVARNVGTPQTNNLILQKEVNLYEKRVIIHYCKSGYVLHGLRAVHRSNESKIGGWGHI